MAAGFFVAMLTPGLGGGEPVTLDTLAVTGDAVPGHADETFRFFDAPTLFDDGEIFFEGVTTLTGTSNTGLYRAPAAGSLGAVVQRGDVALDSFNFTIVPAFRYRANASKDVVFDARIPSLGFWEKRAGAVFFHHPGGSQSIVSGVTDVTHSGYFSTPTSWEFNDADVTLFKTKFDSVNGLFAGIGGVAPRNIAFEGDAVPGIANANFGNLGIKSLAGDGTAYFRSVLTGAGVTSGDDETFWMDAGGTLSLLAREGQVAPGLAGHTLVLTSLLLAPTGNFLLWGDAAGATTITAFWTGTKAGDMVPVVQAEAGKSVVTTTDQGDLAYTTINSPTFAANGDLYFKGVGNRVSDDFRIVGIWKRDATTGAVTLIVSGDITTFSAMQIVSINNSDKLAFLNDGGLWVRDAAGQFTRIVQVGDTLAGRTVASLAAFDARFNDNDTLAFIANFADGDGDHFLDEGVFRATLGSEPVNTEFVWSGSGTTIPANCDTDNWHSLCGDSNWNDDGGSPVSIAPGDAAGQAVTIGFADVVISDRPVMVDALTAGGSLDVRQRLAIETSGQIENLTLSADLIANGGVTLKGADNRWVDGVIDGLSGLAIDDGDTLTIAPTSGALSLQAGLGVAGTVVQSTATLTLADGAGAGGGIQINDGGIYRIEDGTIRDAVSGGADINNHGTFVKSTASDVLLNVPFNNQEAGTISVEEGFLTFDLMAGQHNGGSYQVAAGAELVFQDTTTSVSGDVTASGDGTIWLSGGRYEVDANKTASFNMSEATGGFEIIDDGVIAGDGTVTNLGRMVLDAGRLEADVVNEATLVIGGDNDDFSVRLLEDAQLTNKSFTLHQTDLLINSVTEPYIEIVNEGTYTLSGGVELEVLSATDVNFNNKRGATLRKEGAKEARFLGIGLLNEGKVEVREGTLHLTAGSRWFEDLGIGADTSIEIEPGATLHLGESEAPLFPSSHAFFAATEIRGGGRLLITRLAALEALTDGAGMVNNGSEVVVESGATLRSVTGGWGSPKFENSAGTLRFTAPGTVGAAVVGTDLTNRSGATVTVENGVNIQFQGGEETVNEGDFRILDAGSDLLRGPDFSSKFKNSGRLVIETGGDHLIETTFFGAIRGQRGTVEVRNRTKVRMPQVDPGTFPPLSADVPLLEGEWIVGAGSELVLGPSTFNIRRIGPNARVQLEGDPSDATVPDGVLNQFPNPQGSEFTNDGDLILAGSTFTTQGAFVNHGALRLRPGKLNIPVGYRFRQEGQLLGTGVINGAVVNSGQIAPGSSSGKITVEGDFTQEAGGELHMELGGPEPGVDYDQLVVTGTAALGGCMRLRPMDETFPVNGTLYTPLVATALTGQFNEVIFDVSSGRQVFDVVISETGVTASAMTLDVSTYTAWQAGVFTAEELADENISGITADPDEDGLANLLEYAFDGNPKVVTQSRVEAAFEFSEAGVPSAVEIRFPWANGLSDVQYGLEYSTDLENWNSLPSQVVDSVDSGLSSLVTLTADLGPQKGSVVFMRLRVSEFP